MFWFLKLENKTPGSSDQLTRWTNPGHLCWKLCRPSCLAGCTGSCSTHPQHLCTHRCRGVGAAGRSAGHTEPWALAQLLPWGVRSPLYSAPGASVCCYPAPSAVWCSAPAGLLSQQEHPILPCSDKDRITLGVGAQLHSRGCAESLCATPGSSVGSEVGPLNACSPNLNPSRVITALSIWVQISAMQEALVCCMEAVGLGVFTAFNHRGCSVSAGCCHSPLFPHSSCPRA